MWKSNIGKAILSSKNVPKLRTVFTRKRDTVKWLQDSDFKKKEKKIGALDFHASVMCLLI